MIKHLSRTLRLVGALLACLALPACAADPIAHKSGPKVAETAAAPAAWATDARPALWKIADADTTIYLFGTIHALPPGVPWFDGRIADAFAGSAELVTEIVDEDPATMQSLVMQRAVLPKGKTLRGLLTDAERARFDKAIASLGLPAPTFDTFEPWYAAVGLSTLPLMRDGFARGHGVEEQLAAQAKQRGMPQSGLETAAYQLDLFDALPLDVQKRYLDEVVINLPTLKENLRMMIDAWQRGDAGTLAELMNAKEEDAALLEALLIQRNRTWAGWIDDRLDKPGIVFLAVGAGHLAGKGSVQDQLSARGIVTQRVQ